MEVHPWCPRTIYITLALIFKLVFWAEAQISHGKEEIRHLVASVLSINQKHDCSDQVEESSSNVANAALTKSQSKLRASVLPQLEAAEQDGDCAIDFQI